MPSVTNNAAWVVGWRFSTRILGFVSTLTLVRLLAPADFGLIMLATTFTGAVDALSAAGIQDAIVRDKLPYRELYDTAFTMNAVRCLGTGALIGACAAPCAAFFAEPRLTAVLLVLALVTAAGAGENIRVVDFRRELAFHREFKLLLLPRLAAILASIGVAALWHSYWALVAGMVTNRATQLVLGYVLRPYRPRLRLREWRRIIGFSAWTWLCSLVALTRDRSDNVVIGHAFGTAQVGLFSVGAELAALPTTELVEPLCRVLFPKFSAERHGGTDLAEVFFQTVAVTFLFTLPAGVGIMSVAAPLVALIFGSQWAHAVPVLGMLAIAGAFKVIASISGTLFAATGLLPTIFRIIMISGAVRIALLIALVPAWGLVGGAVAILVSTAIEELLFLERASRRFGFPIATLLRRLWRSAAAAAALAASLSAAGFGWSLSPVLPDHPGRRLLVAVPLGIVVYVASLATIWLLAGRPEGAERQIMREITRLAGIGVRRVRRPPGIGQQA